MERRCGDTRDACSADDDAAIALPWRRKATNDDGGTSASITVDPEIAAPGPMYAGFSGAGWDLKPDGA